MSQVLFFEVNHPVVEVLMERRLT